METGTLAVILVGYALFIPVIWQAGNLFIKKGIIEPLGTQIVMTAAEGAENGSAGAADRTRELKAGRVIGALERLLIVAGLVLGKWEVLVAVITLKTVARFPELEKQIRAEYFLIGSLASVLWALLSAVALLLYDQRLGFGIFPASLLGGIAPLVR